MKLSIKINKKICIAIFVSLVCLLACTIFCSCNAQEHKPLTPDDFKQKCSEIGWNVKDDTSYFLSKKNNKKLGVNTALISYKNATTKFEYYQCDSYDQAYNNFWVYNVNNVEKTEPSSYSKVDIGKYASYTATTNSGGVSKTKIFICCDTNFIYADVLSDNAEEVENALKELGYLKTDKTH